mmetsp:Transcript_2417/g.4738  ORF Transcript_2417/g.4738 Transcript_2417/m.4738 type:complete len:200 (-) Transcript_2417:12-611(-)
METDTMGPSLSPSFLSESRCQPIPADVRHLSRSMGVAFSSKGSSRRGVCFRATPTRSRDSFLTSLARGYASMAWLIRSRGGSCSCPCPSLCSWFCFWSLSCSFRAFGAPPWAPAPSFFLSSRLDADADPFRFSPLEDEGSFYTFFPVLGGRRRRRPPHLDGTPSQLALGVLAQDAADMDQPGPQDLDYHVPSSCLALNR